MTRACLPILILLLAAPAFGKGHGGGHGGGGHSAVPMCSGCPHKKLCRFDELLALKASCFGLRGKEVPKPGGDEPRS